MYKSHSVDTIRAIVKRYKKVEVVPADKYAQVTMSVLFLDDLYSSSSIVVPSLRSDSQLLQVLENAIVSDIARKVGIECSL